MRKPSFLLGAYKMMAFVVVTFNLITFISFVTRIPYQWKPIDGIEGFKASGMKWLGDRHHGYIEFLLKDKEMRKKFVP